ncbi:MAG: hypothetical protein V2A54_13430 [Bacteroidota bacterium]
MVSKFIFLLFLLCSLNKLSAQNEHRLLYERKYTSISGAENLLTLHHGLYSFEEKVFPLAIASDSNKGGYILNCGYRLMKSVAVDYPLDYMVGLTQHEVFGHCARFNEFNYTNISFHLSLPPPFGDGHGFADGYIPINSTFDESVSMLIAGNEANTILSGMLRNRWIADDSMNYRDYFLYMGGHHNITAYIFQNLFKEFGDINQYMYDMNIKYYKSGRKYDIHRLAQQSLIGALDPFQFIATVNWLKYIFKGKIVSKFPSIRIKNIRYLPSFHYGLTPFGSEFYSDHYLKYKSKLFKLYGRLGDFYFKNFWGAGMAAFNIVKTKNIFLDAAVDVWNQPSLRLQDEKTKWRETPSGTGGCLSLTASYNPNIKRIPFFFTAQGGYKTDGFLPGETLSKGFFVRAGLGFRK